MPSAGSRSRDAVCVSTHSQDAGLPGGSGVQSPPDNAGDIGKAPPEEGMAAHSSILAQEIRWMRSLAGYSPWGHRRVGHDLMAKSQQLRMIHCLLKGLLARFCRQSHRFSFLNKYGDFSGGSVVRTWCFHSWGPGSVPGSEMRFHKPHGEAKNRLKKLKQVCILWGDTSRWCKY